ncbi:MAG: hypothetical protein KIT57_03130 [Blastocatellales bacterium]|nr:hypothetical protein [Blastocatellales bacterium]
MISSLRRHHRQAFLVLAVVLPLIFAAGLLVRRSAPVAEAPPVKLPTASDRSGLVAWDEAGLRLGSGADYLDVVPTGAAGFPDILLYWSPGSPEADTPGSHAILLGPIDGVRAQRFPLPDFAREFDGYLIVWSLAHRRAVAVRAWPKGGLR